MKLRVISPAPLCLLFAGLTFSPAPAALAQQEAGRTHSPSKYLYLSNVELKPEQSGAYAKLEGDEAIALRAANAPSHYLAMSSITGGTRVIYMHGFESFADLQKNHDATAALSKLQDTLKADDAQEAPLIADRKSSITPMRRTSASAIPSISRRCVSCAFFSSMSAPGMTRTSGMW